ncbi:MAG: hypothetical protein ACK5PS_18100 [Desulfopila sp.]
MNNTDCAKNIGKSRQMLEAAISGKRNLGYQAAKRASKIFGGTIDIWMDPDCVAIRRQLVERFKGKPVMRKKEGRR